MSEYFQGVTFANQNVSPVDDAVLRRRLLSDGILTGCELTYAGYTLTMAAGYLIACGRQIRRPTAENWAISDATSGYARVLMTIDLTRTATEEVFDQVNTSVEYATAEDGFPALIQDDINATGSQYQVALAVVSLGTGGITGIVSKLELAASSGGGDGGLNFTVVGGTSQPENPKGNTIWVNTDTEISCWVFSPEEPAEPSGGLVWIALGTASPAPFNALKKEALYCYPTACRQYAGGAWVNAEAYVYKDGAWVQFGSALSPYFYQDGDAKIALLGDGADADGYITLTAASGKRKPEAYFVIPDIENYGAISCVISSYREYKPVVYIRRISTGENVASASPSSQGKTVRIDLSGMNNLKGNDFYFVLHTEAVWHAYDATNGYWTYGTVKTNHIWGDAK